jgi:hypothetical protein
MVESHVGRLDTPIGQNDVENFSYTIDNKHVT